MSTMMTNDGVRLDYQIFGTGQPIILVEGYSGNQATWVMQVEPLVNAGLQVITYDRRNHGKSDTVDYGMRMARHGQDLAELMAQLRLEKPILMGHSMGASTIWAYLSLYGDANVRAIITEDQLPKILRDDSWPYGIFNADLTMIWTAATKLPHTKLTRLKLSETVKHALADNYQPFDFQYNEPLLLDSLMQDWRDVLRREQVKHLFIAGQDSPLWPSVHVETVVAMSKNGQGITIDIAGHIPHIEAPDQFNDAVLNFVRTIM
ncbi:MAG: alpha/beta fold hydrolase [Leuconostoc falkenbergense]